MEEKKQKTIAELTLLERLQYSRVEVQGKAKKKSGRGIQGSAYYTQKDFLPVANEVFCKYRITPMFNISGHYEADRYVEIASLDLYDALGKEEKLVFQTPTANVNMQNPIMALGGKHTYLKRYLYLNALELAEAADMVEDTATKQYQKAKDNNPYKTSERQAEELKKYYTAEEINQLLASYKTKNIADVPVDIVEYYIAMGRKGKKNG